MKPGPELDKLIAEKVMKIKPKKIHIATDDNGKSAAASENRNGPFPDHNSIRDWIEDHPPYTLGVWLTYEPYSTSIAASGDIIKELKKKNWGVCLESGTDNNKWTFWIVKDPTGPGVHKVECHHPFVATHETIPMAICLASLKAVQSTEKEKQ